MSKKIGQLFREMRELDPPKKMVGFILSRIERERDKISKRRLIISYFGLGGSSALIIYLSIIFGQALVRSEFFAMISLAFTDVAVVARNWNTFMLSLLETFPTVHVIIFLVPIFMMLISADYYFTNKPNHYRHKLI